MKILYNAPAIHLVPSKYRAWIICLSANLFYFFQVFQANILNSLNSSIVKNFSLSANEISYISSTYFIGMVFFALLAGIVIDHVSRRVVLLTAFFINLVSISVFASAHALWQIFLAQFVTGAVGTFSLICCLKLATEWFPNKKLAFVLGILIAMGSLGGIIAQAPVVWAARTVGWRNTLFINDTFGLIFFLIIIAFVQENFEVTEKLVGLSYRNIKTTLRVIVTNIQNWLGGSYIALMSLSSVIMGALWGNLYLVQSHHLNPYDASLIITLFFIGSIFGSPLLGKMSELMDSIRSPMRFAAILAISISIILITHASLSFMSLSVLFILLGATSSAQSLSYAHVAHSNKKNIASAAQGFTVTIAMIGGFDQNVFAWLMEKNWDQTMLHGQPYYSLGDYRRALLIFPVCYVLALVITLFITKKQDCTHPSTPHV